MFAKRIICTVITLNAIFTASVLYVFLRTSSEPSALVAAWFAFTTGELWHLANIKKHKIKGGASGTQDIQKTNDTEKQREEVNC